MTENFSNLVRTRRRPGLTLVEVLVVFGILAVLFGALIVGGRSMAATGNRNAAKQQIAQLAVAIDRYAGFWPRWEIAGQIVADRGWPDYSPWRLFASVNNGGPYVELANFNDDPAFAVAGAGSGIIEDNNSVGGLDYDRVVIGDVLTSNVCLAYSLTQPRGKGPYLEINDAGAMLKPVQDVDSTINNPALPEHTQSQIAERAMLLVDPWGMPYRYFWYFRDANALRGVLPVPTADPADPNFRRAEGFVLESAGPDRRFGNVWRTGITNLSDPDLLEAEDNIIRVVP